MCWRAYGRTLRHVGPGGGVSGADNNGAHTSVTGSSLTAGDSEGGQHVEWRMEKREEKKEEEEMSKHSKRPGRR